jgi:hypothetical protein
MSTNLCDLRALLNSGKSQKSLGANSVNKMDCPLCNGFLSRETDVVSGHLSRFKAPSLRNIFLIPNHP